MKLPIIHEQRRFPSPALTPQALAWEARRALLWMGSRDLRRIYAIDPADWKVVQETEAPGTRWAARATFCARSMLARRLPATHLSMERSTRCAGPNRMARTGLSRDWI